MRTIRFVIMAGCIVSTGIGFWGCGKKNEAGKTQPVITQDTASPEKAAVDRNIAICIFDGIALKQEPAKTGKWLASISLGETAKWLGDSAIDQSDKNRCYRKIQLSDGKIGWAMSYGLALNARFGATKEDAVICKRPDVLTVTDEKVEFMKPVAIIQEKGDWMEFLGSNRKQSGWIKASSITTDPADVAVAVLAFKKIGSKSAKDYAVKLESFIKSSPYPESFFIQKLKSSIGAPTTTDSAAKLEGVPNPADQQPADTAAHE